MNQEEFVRRYQPQWQGLESLMKKLDETGGRKIAKPAEAAQFSFLYRQTCHHLALARDRNYAAHLIERLNQLVLRGHQRLYQARAGMGSRIIAFAAQQFPALVRNEARLFWVSCALLAAPGLAMTLGVLFFPDMAYTVLEPGQIAQIEEMYRPDAGHLGRERQSDSDFLMFGFYIRNNIGIGFQTFAGGLLFGLGSIFYLLFNGVFLGTVAGHLTHAGFGETFYPFVIGHGAFELTAIVLAGAAGLKMGFALLSPGRQTRMQALKEAAKVAVMIVYGAAAMLVIAAFLEAFWSSSMLVPPAVKYGVGGFFWLLVAAYFLILGRSRGA